MNSLEQRVVAEVELQHELLERWLGSECDPAVLDQLRESHSDGFSMVTVDGRVVSVSELFTDLAGARNAAAGLRIQVSDVELVHTTDESVLTRFLETHRAPGGDSRRRVTALLLQDATARHGLRWHHLHETHAC